MIATFFYSIAGQKQSNTIDDMLRNLSTLECINPKDRNTADYCLQCAEHGNYPSAEYFVNLYEKPATLLKTEAELVLHYKATVDLFQRQSLLRNITQRINETSTTSDLLGGLSKLITETESASDDEFDFSDYKPELYGDLDLSQLNKGLQIGIEELDNVTHGFQRGTVASICGFTGHGKSTLCNSMIYQNVMEGKKVLLLSIELAPNLAWKYFETRYMFEKKGLGVSLDGIMNNIMDAQTAEIVKANEEDCRRELSENLLIIDENMINKKMMQDFRKISKLFKAAERKLGGLDMVVVDHVGQLELQFPEMGNIILRQLTSAAKTYKNERGEKIVMVWAVQCNREGNKRAIRREGQYDLQAIADLNEVERSSSYCVFLYTSDAMKITQETKVSMLKNRLGVPIPVPFITSFTPSVVMVGKKFERANINDVDFSFTQMNGDFEDLPPF